MGNKVQVNFQKYDNKIMLKESLIKIVLIIENQVVMQD
jgi:hypothetical protein